MNYQTARIVLDVFHKARAMLDTGLTMRSIKEEFLRSQLVESFPEGGETVAIYERLSVCRSKAKFLEALDGFTDSTLRPVFIAHERRMTEIRAYNEERAELTVDQAHTKAIEQEADLRRYWLERSRPNGVAFLSADALVTAVAYAHEEALEMDAARALAPFPYSAPRKTKTPNVRPVPPAPPVAQMPPVAPVAAIPRACIYISGLVEGDSMEVLYNVGTEDETRRVYVLQSLPVRVGNTCFQTVYVKQIGDHREHRIAFNATTDSYRLFNKKEVQDA